MSESESNKIRIKRVAESNKTRLIITLEGKNHDLWKKNEPRLKQRLKNSLKSVFQSDITPGKAISDEFKSMVNAALLGAKAVIERPQLENQARSANIKKSIAQTKQIEAETKKLSMEEKRKQVHESQRYIERKIQRGELVVIEKDGVTYVACKNSEV